MNLQSCQYDGFDPSLGTSADGTMFSSPSKPEFCYGQLGHVEGTVGQRLLNRGLVIIIAPLCQTNTGRLKPEKVEESQNTGAATMELYRLSGLTWDQLADLFDVSRRSVHFWASGKPLNAINENCLRRILAVIRQVDRGSAKKNRTMLLGDRSGVIPFDLLRKGSYQSFIELVGNGDARSEPILAPISIEALDMRRPLPIDELVDALQDAVKVSSVRTRPGRAVRTKK